MGLEKSRIIQQCKKAVKLSVDVNVVGESGEISTILGQTSVVVYSPQPVSCDK